MYGPQPTWAVRANEKAAGTESLEAYLRTEYRGGMTAEAFLADHEEFGAETGGGIREAAIRALKAMLANLRRVGAAPAALALLLTFARYGLPGFFGVWAI